MDPDEIVASMTHSARTRSDRRCFLADAGTLEASLLILQLRLPGHPELGVDQSI